MEQYAGKEIYLKNNRLTVGIAVPGTRYKGSRFDWNGFITGVKLDHCHTFCVPESMTQGEGSGGQGLCCEFGIDRPVGYDEAKVGEYFPKIGVGILKKPDDRPYDFFREYECIPEECIVSVKADCVTFAIDSRPCRGYAYTYHKEVSVDENRLTISCTLKNTGEKPIETNEYCHNFLGIDGMAVGKGYTLRLPQGLSASVLKGELYYKDGVITWPDALMQEQFYCMIEPPAAQQPYSWALTHTQSGAGVRETDDFTPCRVALWGFRHVISPEAFVGISLACGEIQTWTREYEFSSQ